MCPQVAESHKSSAGVHGHHDIHGPIPVHSEPDNHSSHMLDQDLSQGCCNMI